METTSSNSRDGGCLRPIWRGACLSRGACSFWFVYAVFAIGLLVTQFVFKKPAIKQMLGKEMELPDKIWNNLNLAWAIFFTLLGAINIYVAFNMSQEIWVNFKVFGLLSVTIVFTVLSGLYLYKYLPKEDKENAANEKKSEE